MIERHGFPSNEHVACSVVYAFLELIIIPAVPLTMAAGVLFGVGPGLAVVSFASTAAAAIAFLITRYLARDKACWTISCQFSTPPTQIDWLESATHVYTACLNVLPSPESFARTAMF